MIPKLQIEGVHKSYGRVAALHPTSLDVKQGEFMTLLGPSGSGKTTLLMIVAGLQMPDGGCIRIGGTDATFTPPFKRDIGMVFQNYALFPHLTVFENIAFSLRRRRRAEKDIRSAVGQALEIVQLGHVADRLPSQLSGGQQQRIALARCIVYKPSIILMDEPLGALDKKLRDQLQLEIKRIHVQLGTTILYVTHDQQETLTMSDRVCLMNGGSVVQLSTPKELYFKPDSLFAADFLGDSNIFEGVVNRSGRAATIDVPELGKSIRAENVAAPADTRVSVVMRPERLKLSRAEAAVSEDNALSGRIESIIFIGNITKYVLRLDTGASLLISDLTGDEDYKEGDRIFASWRIAHTIVIGRAE